MRERTLKLPKNWVEKQPAVNIRIFYRKTVKFRYKRQKILVRL